MNLKKRALHLAVTASMVGAFVTTVGVQAAHAIHQPDACGAYLQGTIDPTGSLIPGGLIPAPVGINTVGQRSYAVVGHESYGQDRILNDLNNNTFSAYRFGISVTLGGTIGANPAASGPVAPLTGSATGTTKIFLKWQNTSNGGPPRDPYIDVKEYQPTAHIGRGYVVGVPGSDKLGAQAGVINAGNNGTGPGPVSGIPGPASSTTVGLYVPPVATSGTFKLSMTFPAVAGPPVAGNTYHSGDINVVGLTPTIIATSLNTAVAPSGPGDGGSFGNLGGGVSVVAGPNPGSFVISFAGTALANQPLPTLDALLANQTGALATTVADDGSMWNATRVGGVDPSIAPIHDFGNGVFVSSGVMSSGNIPTPTHVPAGHVNYVPDTQYVMVQYPAGLASALVPNLATDTLAQGLLQSIIGANLSVTLDPCGLVGMLGVFCTAANASIPPMFSGICGIL